MFVVCRGVLRLSIGGGACVVLLIITVFFVFVCARGWGEGVVVVAAAFPIIFVVFLVWGVFRGSLAAKVRRMLGVHGLRIMGRYLVDVCSFIGRGAAASPAPTVLGGRRSCSAGSTGTSPPSRTGSTPSSPRSP